MEFKEKPEPTAGTKHRAWTDMSWPASPSRPTATFYPVPSLFPQLILPVPPFPHLWFLPTHPTMSLVQSSQAPQNKPIPSGSDPSVCRWSQARLSHWPTVVGVTPGPWGWCPPGVARAELGYWVSLAWCSASPLLRAWADEPLIAHSNRYISPYWLCHGGNRLLHLPRLLQESRRREAAPPPLSAAAHKERGCPACTERPAADSGRLSALSCPSPSQWPDQCQGLWKASQASASCQLPQEVVTTSHESLGNR